MPEHTTVKVVQSQYGSVLADKRGQAFYAFGKDSGARSQCYGACASRWPPALAKGKLVAGAGAHARLLGRTRRGDGRLQLTYAGHPLFRTPEVSEIQAAVRKEFPANETVQAVFKANESVPTQPRQLLALARLVVREAPDHSANLVKYAINAATVKHLSYLSDQLEKEMGGADPEGAVRAAEEQIRAAAARAFAGKPELDAFVSP